MDARIWPLLCATFASGACAFVPVTGSGHVVTESRPVSGFSAVALGGNAELFIEQTGTESLTVTTDDNLLRYLSMDVRGGTLDLTTTDPFTQLRPTMGIIFTLTVRQLKGLEVSGRGNVRVNGVAADRLEISISGAGEVAAQGSAHDLALSISGAGRYRGADMNSERARVDISGAGRALVAPRDELSAQISGAGTVQYTGDPRVTQHVSGAGSVRRR
jgi:Putative auto-transporter adhesin, head GIN domain